MNYYTRKAAAASLMACLLAAALVVVVLCRSSAQLVDGSLLRRRRRATERTVVVCRITLEETLMGGNNASSANKETSVESHQHTICTPIVDNTQLDVDSIVHLPVEMVQQYQKAIAEGTLIVAIEGATLGEANRLNVGDSPHFVVLEDTSFDGHRGRHLMEPVGPKTVAIVRISTQNSEQENSASEIQQGLFGGGTSFATQLEDCSHGKISLSLKAIIDVKVPRRNADYEDEYDLLAASTTWLNENGYPSMGDFADRTIFCYPDGFGTWAAKAALNHWRINVSFDILFGDKGKAHTRHMLLTLYLVLDIFVLYYSYAFTDESRMVPVAFGWYA